MRAHIVFNPVAGRLPGRQAIRRAADRLRAEGWSVTVGQTRGPQDVTAQARRAADERCDVVFAAGGDGTVGWAADGLADSDTALGVLPVGTANVWAQEIGLVAAGDRRRASVEEAAAAQARGRIQAVDLGRCGERHFLLWAGAGLDEYLIGRLEPRRRMEKLLGRPYYLLKSLLIGVPYRGRSMSVQVDGREVVGQTLLALVTNIRLYGGGWFWLDRAARVDDGHLEVWAFEGANYVDAIAHLARLWVGRHASHAGVRRLSGTCIRMESDPPGRLTSDGDVTGITTPAAISVRPRALKVLAPRDAPSGPFTQPPLAVL